jgi:hypothetical protein
MCNLAILAIILINQFATIFFLMVNYLVTIFFLNYKSLATLYFFLIANVANQVDIWNWQLMDKRGCTLHKCSGNEC